MKAQFQHPLEIFVEPSDFQQPSFLFEVLEAFMELSLLQLQWDVISTVPFLHPNGTLK